MSARPKPFSRVQRSPLPNAGPTPAELAYWAARVLRQRYTAHARPGSENELFARLEHDGQWIYFPLGSHLPEKAAVRACEINRALAADGWNAVRQRYVRQIIWAIYWFAEPLACTYATLFSIPSPKPVAAKAPPSAGKKIPVAIVEPELEVLRSLEHCLNLTPDYACVQKSGLAKELLQQPVSQARPPQVVFFNQRSLDLATAAFQQQLQTRWPGVIAIPFGTFGHSDELFMSVTGMDRGYFLRRRPPGRLLEPLANFWPGDSPVAHPPRSHFQHYFQKLMLADNPPSSLSQRETEMLRYLGDGHTDKTIASRLGISVWTVHSHMKSIFEKLGVHTRAEAVMRHLQK
jgi:DNA-binding NarL/FixJ family response regulator